MRALVWHGVNDIRYDNVPDPQIQNHEDVIIKVTSTAICGSDLHIMDGLVPTMKSGDILGHEFMGEVVEVGKNVTRLSVGDRVVVPFTISCGHCFFCDRTLYSLCDRSNPDPEEARKRMGHSPAGIFGYSHMLGGFDGGQAEYVRVPYADIGPLKIESPLTDEQVLFLSDIFPTGYMAAENAEIKPGDTVAIWGCGPVGQFTIQSVWLLGAGRVIAIDHVKERLELAETAGRAETINFDHENVYDRLMQMTDNRGPDRCVDAVGAEGHGTGLIDAAKRKLQETTGLIMDRSNVLAEIVMCCRKGGTISIPGVYVGGILFPIGSVMNKGITIRTGQTHMQRYMRPLLEIVERGELDPRFIITHRATLDHGPDLYKTFRDKDDKCIKVVMRPDEKQAA